MNPPKAAPLVFAFALAAGAGLACSFAPLNWWPLALLCPAVLMWLWEDGDPARAAWSGLCFGAGTFGLGTCWLYVSVHGFGGAPVWLTVFVVLGLVGIMALYHALLGYLAVRYLPRRSGWRYLAGLPALWLLIEWLRGWFLSGFPWLTLGLSQTDTWLAGFAPVTGVYGISALLLLGSGALLALLRGAQRLRMPALCVLLLPWPLGLVLERIDWTRPDGAPVSVAVLQGAIPQDQKWQADNVEPTRDLYTKLNEQALGAQLIVWPESALPELANEVPQYLGQLYSRARVHGSDIVMGIIRADDADDYYNSIMTLSDHVSFYSKHHLVPFAEYFPVPPFIRSWLRLMSLPYSDFTAGPADQPAVAAGGTMLGLSICYEDAYNSADLPALAQARVLVNVTNDAWFGHSWARYQHFQIARMRAMEARRPLVRAANDGVSALVDAHGAVTARASEFESTVLRGTVQPRIGLPPFARLGNGAIVLPALLVVALAIQTARRRSRASRNRKGESGSIMQAFPMDRSRSDMSHQDVGPRLLGAIALVTLFAACSPQSSTAAAPADPPAAASVQVAAAAAPAAPQPAAPASVRGLPDFADLVTQVGPAVVNVQVVERPQGGSNADSENDNEDQDDPFGDFFRHFGIPRGAIPQQPRNFAPVRGIGSGFIISADGYILTNAHVVANASKITVKLTDRREFEGKVIGVDERTDVAVIKISAKGNLPVVRIGDSSKLRPGQWVLAIGSPFGFENSVTAGVVSATARSNVGEGGNGYVPFIQSDVAVNPGNSGGPLFNLDGEVVGINSQIYSRSGGYEGISFAIPISVANNVAEQLVKNGHVSRGRIGVTIQEVTAATAENFGLDRPHGAAVASVESGGPADKAGIEPLDIILSVNGKPIDTSDQLPPLIAEIKPGQAAQLEVWRDKSIKRISVTVEELKEKTSIASNRRNNGGGSQGETAVVNRIGLSVRTLTANEKSQLKTRGSIVVVDANGPAAEAGIREGDVILSINRESITSVEQFQAAVKSAGRSATLLIQHDAQQSIVTITLQ